jgi:hypothetical protein
MPTLFPPPALFYPCRAFEPAVLLDSAEDVLGDPAAMNSQSADSIVQMMPSGMATALDVRFSKTVGWQIQ